MSQTISPDFTVEAEAKTCCQKRAEMAPPSQAEASKRTTTPSISIAAIATAYKPIVVIAGAATAGSLMLAGAHGGGAAQIMQSFMGLFLLPLALLKLFDIGGFATAFARYDVVARVWPFYGWLYPFAELALALLFLSGLFAFATNIAALLIGAIGTMGIARTLLRGEAVRCACVGSTLDVPLGSVSILENAGMALMAAAMLAM